MKGEGWLTLSFFSQRDVLRYIFFVNLIFQFSIFPFSKNRIDSVDRYLSKWLKKNDSVIVYNYKKSRTVYTYNKKLLKKNIPIGSITKIITTFFILKYKPELEDYKYRCLSKDIISHKETTCWNKKGHGVLSLREAFTNSCNNYFYNLYRFIEINLWLDVAYFLGVFTDKNINFTQDDIPFIYAGNLSKLKVNSYQLINLINKFAVIDDQLDFKVRQVLKKISVWMRDVVLKGTAYKVKFNSFQFSGKTGTSSDENGQFYGVFIGFLKNRPYSIAIVLNDKIGSNAALIASDIFYLLFNKNR